MSAALSAPRLTRLRLRHLDPLLLVAAVLLLWEAVATWTHGIAISGPAATFAYAGGLLLTARFWDNAGATAGAFAAAFLLSAALGLLLGLVLGFWRFAGEVAEPVLAGFYTIPKVTLYPVVLLLFGLGVGAKVAFGVMHGLVPVTLFAVAAIRDLPPVLRAREPPEAVTTPMTERYWLVHPNGGRQLIDPDRFDLGRLVERARAVGGRLEVEARSHAERAEEGRPPRRFEPPLSALGPIFRDRLGRIYEVRAPFLVDMNPRPTTRVLGGYYRRNALVRVYTHDRHAGRRPLEELFDTFLHEVAHHLEYSEPDSFRAEACGRVRGRMHSRLFWHILRVLKRRWAALQAEG